MIPFPPEQTATAGRWGGGAVNLASVGEEEADEFVWETKGWARNGASSSSN